MRIVVLSISSTHEVILRKRMSFSQILKNDLDFLRHEWFFFTLKVVQVFFLWEIACARIFYYQTTGPGEQRALLNVSVPCNSHNFSRSFFCTGMFLVVVQTPHPPHPRNETKKIIWSSLITSLRLQPMITFSYSCQNYQNYLHQSSQDPQL